MHSVAVVQPFDDDFDKTEQEEALAETLLDEPVAIGSEEYDDKDLAAECPADAVVPGWLDDNTLNEISLKLYYDMLPQINQVASKCLGFSRVNELADFQQDSWFAIRDAVLHYSRVHEPSTRGTYAGDFNSKLTVMRKEVFAQWYIRKAIHKAADMRDVQYRLFNRTGEYVNTVSNSDFRKQKGELRKRGYTWEAVKTNFSFSEMTRDDGRGMAFEPAAEFEDAIA